MPAGSLSFEELLDGTTILRSGGDPALLSVRVQPRQLADGTFFFKLRSSQFRGSAAEAIRKGARFLVLESGDEEEATLPPTASYAIVDSVNRAYARTCSRVFGDEHRQLTLIGVTGAKGKTAVCHLIDAALRASGVRTGLVSSLVVRMPDAEQPAAGWTAHSLAIHGFLSTLRERGATHAVLELHSLGIAEEWLLGLQFDALVFTNDGAGDGDDAHRLANRRLFTDPAFHKSPETLCVCNADDPAGRALAATSPGRAVTYGLDGGDVSPERCSFDRAGFSIRLDGRELRYPLIGRHHASNVLAAIATANAILPSYDAAVALQDVRPLPARLERLPAPLDVDVYLDQPYMPANIDASLRALRELAGSRRIVCVIGCAGGIGRELRPARARAAMNGSDLCILTSDDPRGEHPGSIVIDMSRGMQGAAAGRWKVIVDRATAIDTAIREALPGGIVVVMGRRAIGTELRDADRQAAAASLQAVASEAGDAVPG